MVGIALIAGDGRFEGVANAGKDKRRGSAGQPSSVYRSVVAVDLLIVNVVTGAVARPTATVSTDVNTGEILDVAVDIDAR